MKIADCVMKSMIRKQGFKCDASWKTKVEGNKVRVQHYNTDLLDINISTRAVKRAVGFESQSDKVAVGKILREIGVAKKDVQEIKADRGHRF